MPIAPFDVKDTREANRQKQENARKIKQRFELPVSQKARALARLQQDVFAVVRVARDSMDTERSSQMILDLIERETEARVAAAIKKQNKGSAAAKAKRAGVSEQS